MSQPKVIPSYADLAWAWAGDAAKFQSRANTNNNIKELVLFNSNSNVDDFSADPFVSRWTKFGLNTLWDAGNKWVYVPNINGGYGIYFNSAGTYTNVRVKAKLKTHQFWNGWPDNVGILARWDSGAGKGYELVIGIPYPGSKMAEFIALVKRTGTGYIDWKWMAYQAFPSDPLTWYHFELLIIGNRLKGKVWKDGDAEPTTGGWDNDGYIINCIDDEYSSAGYSGIFLTDYHSPGGVGDDFEVHEVMYNSSSPRYIFRTDSGKINSVWAGGTFDIGANLNHLDVATISIYEAYSNSLWGPGDEVFIQVALGSELPIINGQVQLVGGIGQYRYIVIKVASALGMQQGSFILMDTGQDLIIPADLINTADAKTYTDNPSAVQGEKIKVKGKLVANNNLNIRLDIKVKTEAGVLVDILFGAKVNLSSGDNDIETACGSIIEWNTSGKSAGIYIFHIDVTDGDDIVAMADTDLSSIEIVTQSYEPLEELNLIIEEEEEIILIIEEP